MCLSQRGKGRKSRESHLKADRRPKKVGSPPKKGLNREWAANWKMQPIENKRCLLTWQHGSHLWSVSLVEFECKCRGKRLWANWECVLEHSVISDSLRPYGLYVARQAPLSMGFSRQGVGKTRQDNGLPWWLSGKESACNSGDTGSIPRSGRSPGEGHGNPLQYSGLGNPMDRGAWLATVHGVAKSQTRLSD